jgi:hypothetical protein
MGSELAINFMVLFSLTQMYLTLNIHIVFNLSCVCNGFSYLLMKHKNVHECPGGLIYFLKISGI